MIPVQSMTGYGRAVVRLADGCFRIELRSVNGRHLDARANLPFSDAELETLLLRRVRERLERGRIDLNIVEEWEEGSAKVHPNLALAAAHRDALEAIRSALGLADHVSLEMIAAQRGVLSTAPCTAPPRVHAALLQGLDEALDGLVRTRAEEGAVLVSDLRARVASIRAAAIRLRGAAAAAPEAARRRLQARIDELLGSDARLEPARLAAEVALLAARSDVHEEMVRTQSHLDRADAMLAGAGPLGRKLDFLCQEIGREVNTMGAKIDDLAALSEILHMKAELEKVREQAQNLE